MNDLYPIFDRTLTRAEKESRLGQHAAVVWLYGLSGSGKSTLACSLERKLHSDGVTTMLLDGDNVRTGLNANLGFSDEDRRENIRRVAEVAKLFVECGIVTLASFITPSRSMRSLARETIGEDFMEIFVDCPFEVCAERDVKGLYAKAAAGKVANFTGKDSGFEPPAPEDDALTLHTAEETPADSLERLYRHVIGTIRPTESH